MSTNKYKKCENCRRKTINKTKSGIKAVGVTAFTVILFWLNKGGKDSEGDNMPNKGGKDSKGDDMPNKGGKGSKGA